MAPSSFYTLPVQRRYEGIGGEAPSCTELQTAVITLSILLGLVLLLLIWMLLLSFGRHAACNSTVEPYRHRRRRRSIQQFNFVNGHNNTGAGTQNNHRYPADLADRDILRRASRSSQAPKEAEEKQKLDAIRPGEGIDRSTEHPPAIGSNSATHPRARTLEDRADSGHIPRVMLPCIRSGSSKHEVEDVEPSTKGLGIVSPVSSPEGSFHTAFSPPRSIAQDPRPYASTPNAFSRRRDPQEDPRAYSQDSAGTARLEDIYNTFRSPPQTVPGSWRNE